MDNATPATLRLWPRVTGDRVPILKRTAVFLTRAWLKGQGLTVPKIWYFNEATGSDLEFADEIDGFWNDRELAGMWDEKENLIWLHAVTGTEELVTTLASLAARAALGGNDEEFCSRFGSQTLDSLRPVLGFCLEGESQ